MWASRQHMVARPCFCVGFEKLPRNDQRMNLGGHTGSRRTVCCVLCCKQAHDQAGWSCLPASWSAWRRKAGLRLRSVGFAHIVMTERLEDRLGK
jgi:hypothetical protein